MFEILTKSYWQMNFSLFCSIDFNRCDHRILSIECRCLCFDFHYTLWCCLPKTRCWRHPICGLSIKKVISRVIKELWICFEWLNFLKFIWILCNSLKKKIPFNVQFIIYRFFLNSILTHHQLRLCLQIETRIVRMWSWFSKYTFALIESYTKKL